MDLYEIMENGKVVGSYRTLSEAQARLDALAKRYPAEVFTIKSEPRAPKKQAIKHGRREKEAPAWL